VPVAIKTKDGEALFDRDEHPRPDSSLEKLASLRPLLIKEDPDATVTAGNASGENDAAACCIVTSPEKAGGAGTEADGETDILGYIRRPPGVHGRGPGAGNEEGPRTRPDSA